MEVEKSEERSNDGQSDIIIIIYLIPTDYLVGSSRSGWCF